MYLSRFLAALALTASLLVPASHARAQTGGKKLVLEEFFKGRLTAQGIFTNTRDGTKRGLKVQMRGTWNGKALTLVEDFVYSDGERDRKTWVFTKLAEGRYIGRREDVIGEADVYQEGNDMRFKYVANVKASGSTYNLTFSDRLKLVGKRDVLNTADVSFLFLPVGNVELKIRKIGR